MNRKIPLYTLEGVRDCRISTHPFTTADMLGLSLTRFLKEAADDVVMIIHGLTTSMDMFIMPEHKNLVTYLHENGFTDVWCLDYRMSNRYSYNLMRHRYTLDDIALFDYPPAINAIRKEIGPRRRIHVISHCLGAVSFTMGLFGGVINGVRSVVANSVALTPRVPAWSKFKLRTAPFLLEKIINEPYISPGWGEESGWTPGKIISRCVDVFHHECNVRSCHMLSFMWGAGKPALYSHANLLDVTHERGGDLYGPTSAHYYRHVLKMVNAGHAVKYDPANKALSPLPDDYFERARLIQTPVLFMTGKQNYVFADSNVVCFQKLEIIVPGRHELHEFDGYGHQDVFMGKAVHIDIFPRIATFLRQNSSDAATMKAA
jgi:pimeloyl-ACP methyl ester carboxylesterase